MGRYHSLVVFSVMTSGVDQTAEETSGIRLLTTLMTSALYHRPSGGQIANTCGTNNAVCAILLATFAQEPYYQTESSSLHLPLDKITASIAKSGQAPI